MQPGFLAAGAARLDGRAGLTCCYLWSMRFCWPLYSLFIATWRMDDAPAGDARELPLTDYSFLYRSRSIMKKLSLTLSILFTVCALAFAGPEAISGKDMKEVVQPMAI